jgi:hypothetical protein
MSYSNGEYEIISDDTDSNGFKYSDNVPKFNQLDIPISQGENVELQVRLVWGFGYPFVTVATSWSESITVTFPDELVQDVQVTTIIEENNSDIETNRFENILSDKGVTEHVDDAIDDQDIQYLHKPESISSGFYTSERRIIPLKDKLMDMSADIAELQDALENTSSEVIDIKFIVDGSASTLLPDINNVIQLPAWISVSETEEGIPTGASYKKDDVVYSTGSMVVTNTTEHTVYLFSVFPGPRDMSISDIKTSRRIFDPKNYDGVNIIWTADTETSKGDVISKEYSQRPNQIITYRCTNPYDGSTLGSLGDSYIDSKDAYDSAHTDNGKYSADRTSTNYGVWAYPISPNKYGLCMDTDATNAKYRLAPGESVQFDTIIEYKLDSTTKAQDAFTLGFDVRTSLYSDPLYYQVQLVAKYNQTTSDLLNSAKTSVQTLTTYNVTVR